MLSFSEITKENKDALAETFSKELCGEAKETLAGILSGLDLDSSDVGFAVTCFSGCALIRVFDMGRYLFIFPYEIEESADVNSAIFAISEYAVREEIPLTFCDVPRECISAFSGFRHIELDAEDAEAESYRVKIKSECELIDEIPHVTYGRVELNALFSEDIEPYAELCRDKKLNEYWGYDYTSDVENPADAYFYESAVRDFSFGTSLTMAVRFEGKFIGEAVIYAFDRQGGAEFSIRLLPSFHSKGLGTEAAIATVAAARRLGLIRLRATVMNKNLPSLAMFRKITDEFAVGDGKTEFFISL